MEQALASDMWGTPQCEQAYKLQPICGEYGESIFSLSQYTSENVA